MGKQYHFVVMYDSDRDEFSVDYDSQDVRFEGEPIFDTSTAKWEALTEEEHWGLEGSEYNKSADALVEAIQYLQIRQQ